MFKPVSKLYIRNSRKFYFKLFLLFPFTGSAHTECFFRALVLLVLYHGQLLTPGRNTDLTISSFHCLIWLLSVYLMAVLQL